VPSNAWGVADAAAGTAAMQSQSIVVARPRLGLETLSAAGQRPYNPTQVMFIWSQRKTPTAGKGTVNK